MYDKVQTSGRLKANIRKRPVGPYKGFLKVLGKQLVCRDDLYIEFKHL
jgi:hypothetical protein